MIASLANVTKLPYTEHQWSCSKSVGSARSLVFLGATLIGPSPPNFLQHWPVVPIEAPHPIQPELYPFQMIAK
jgi:hypothetical protein